MKLFLIKITVIIISVFIITSCSEEKKEIVKTKVDSSVKIESPVVVQTIEKNIPKPKVVESGKLTDYLPSGIPGAEKTPFKSGIIDEDNRIVTVASCEYVFPNHGFFKFSITDYGIKKFVPDFEIRLFEKPPIESGKTTESFTLANGKGYVIWNETNVEGSLFALVSDRFILRIDAMRVSTKAIKLQDYLKYFKIKELTASIQGKN